MEETISELKDLKTNLERQVAELRAKAEQVERRATELRQAEEKKHAEEIDFLKKTNQQLKVSRHATCFLYILYPEQRTCTQKPRRWTRLDTPLHVFPTLKGSFSTVHIQDNLGRPSLLLPLGFPSKVSHSITSSLLY